jgi:Immunity protein Imm6
VRWYVKVNIDAKAAYFLALSEKILDKLAPYENWHSIARKTLDLCWEWVEDKRVDEDEIYMKVNDEDEGFFMIGLAEIDPFQGNSQAESAYWCIFGAVSYMIRLGHIKNNKEHELPQELEKLDDEFNEQRFMEEIKKTDGYQKDWSERLKEYLMENYPARSDKRIRREELLKLIA